MTVARLSRSSRLLLACLGCTLALHAGPASAQSDLPPARGVIIGSAVADPSAGTLALSGENFASGKDPRVVLGDEELTVTGFDDGHIDALLPAGLTPGDYRLVVSTAGRFRATSRPTRRQAETTLTVPGGGSDPNDLDADPTNELQDLSFVGTSLSITDGIGVDLSSLRDDADADPTNELQTLSLVGTNLSITGGSSIDLSPILAGLDPSISNELQDLSLTGTMLSLSGSAASVSLDAFLDDTDEQPLADVLQRGTSAGGRDVLDVGTLETTDFTCDGCIDTADIAKDTIGGNDITDDIYILHVDCNGDCTEMTLRDACDVVEDLRGLSVETELMGVSCVHDVPSTAGNGFVPCTDGAVNECRAFNLRTLGDIPCIDGTGTDAIVTCLATDTPK